MKVHSERINSNKIIKKFDSRINNSQIIYEAFKRKQFEENRNTRNILFGVSVAVAVNVLIIITLLQYYQYVNSVTLRTEFRNHTEQWCNLVDFANFDVISTPLSFMLVVSYIILYKRRVYKRYDYKYRNIGLPMIVSCWNKSDRLYTSMVYGLIAINVVNIVKSTLNDDGDQMHLQSTKLLDYDPTGITKLIFKLIQVFIIGTRYYPILSAYRCNSFFLVLTSCLFAWIDFIENIYQYGICDWNEDEIKVSKSEFVAYKFFATIPLAIFSSIICVSLTYRIFLSFFDYWFKIKNISVKKQLIESSKDSYFHLVLNINDDNEILYSICNINYVFFLFNPNLKFKEAKFKNKHLNKAFELFNKYIYKWDDNFRFTSRFLNTMVVAFVSLYYFFLFWYYFLLKKLSTLQLDVINIKSLLCGITESICFKNSKLAENVYKSIDNFITTSIESDTSKKVTLNSSIKVVATLPIFISYMVCMIQLLLIAKDCKTHLLELYKGDCEFIKKAKNLENAKIAGSSFHFGGFLVGYLIWGYFIIYIFFFLICAFMAYINLYSSETYLQILKTLVPFIAILGIKTLVNKFTAKYVFLNRRSKILALENFRAFNVFLYFNFFFDCLMGLISAIIRLFKAVVAAIIMMPRISYSFLGRHLEKHDNGYSCYSGFLHMEAMHTNPIITTFCCLLYYPELSDHIRKYLIETKKNAFQKNSLPEFIGKLSRIELNQTFVVVKNIKNYNKIVVNRWHVCLMLNKNKSLLVFRKTHQS